jgi:hypothetical protein
MCPSSRSNRTLSLPVIKCLTALVLGGVAIVSARAETPFFSGPSITKLAAPTTFSGKSFAANAAVTVMLKSPDGSSAGYSAVTAADGSFKYTLTLPLPGAYTITVADSGGRTLASAVVAALP